MVVEVFDGDERFGVEGRLMVTLCPIRRAFLSILARQGKHQTMRHAGYGRKTWRRHKKVTMFASVKAGERIVPFGK